MNLFVRITAAVAIGIVVLIALAFILKILVVAAVVAAFVLAGLGIANLARRRRAAPVATYTGGRWSWPR